jgi:hypothetical protein
MILYKYYPDNANSYKAISLRGLWCHYPKKMNDPSDCLGYLDIELSKSEISLIKNYFKKNSNPSLSKIFRFSDDQVTNFINLQRRDRINRSTFCSLSEDFTDILMWSHYASSHTGFVIEFEFSDSEIDYHFQKIEYTDQLPKFDAEKFCNAISNDFENVGYFLKDISIKSTAWASEKEWRIWRKEPCYYYYKPENIKNIYFGVNCSLDTKSIVSKIIGDWNNTALYNFMEYDKNPIRLKYLDKI